MKTVLTKVLTFLVIFNFASAAPSTGHRWEFIPDSESRMHLIDMENFDQPIEPAFDATTDIIFTLRTRRNPFDGERVVWNDMNTIRNSLFDRSRPTMFTIHGWNGGGGAAVNWRVNEGYFTLGDYNMIGVDWSAGSTTINYVSSSHDCDYFDWISDTISI